VVANIQKEIAITQLLEITTFGNPKSSRNNNISHHHQPTNAGRPYPARGYPQHILLILLNGRNLTKRSASFRRMSHKGNV
jgi:hypothetical protein